MRSFYPFLLILLIACNELNHSRDKYLDESINLDENNIPINGNYSDTVHFENIQSYFPDDLNVAGADWYSIMLYYLKEPLLFSTKSEKEIYRFLWLRTFSYPVAIRIERTHNDFKLYLKVSKGAGGYTPGELFINKEIQISEDSWEEFLTLLEEMNYWNYDPNEKGIGGLDGSQWILEAATPDKYHVVDRWSPREEGSFYKVCTYLIKLTECESLKKEIY